MADWIFPCNPDYYDIAGSFEELNSIDWRQTAKGVLPGDTVYIYVGKPIQAIAYTYLVIKTMIPSDQEDSSDTKFAKGNNNFESYPLNMRLKPVCRIPLNVLTLDRMREAGLRGNIQGPRLVPEELRELFDTAKPLFEPKDAMKHSESVPDEARKSQDTNRKSEERDSVETEVNARVQAEFMRQIQEKKAELVDLDMKRENVQKEISLLENMLARLKS